MKKLLFIALSLLFITSSCSSNTNKGYGEAEKGGESQETINNASDDAVKATRLAGELYYLQKDRLYVLDLATNDKKELKLANKPISNINISPDGKYLAYEIELYNSDCNGVTSLAFYDLSTEDQFEKIEGKKGKKSIHVSRWEIPVAVVYAVVDLEDEENTKYYRWTMRTGQKEELTMEEYNNDESGPEYQENGQFRLDCPFDANWTAMNDGEKIYLVNNKSDNKTDVVETAPDDYQQTLRFHLSEWLDATHLTYVIELLPEAQCGPINYNIYIYDLATKTSKLILEDVGPFCIIRDIEE